MILLCPPEKSTQFHYPLDPKKILAEGSMHKDTTYQGSDRQDFYRHGKKKTKKKKKKKTNKQKADQVTSNKAADRNHDRKNYYRLVHQSAREKMELSKDHFKDLVVRLLGDKDHERVLDIVKVEKKSNRKKLQANDNRGASVARPSRLFSLRCYFCHRRGHIKADCPDLKSKQRKTDPKSDK